MTKIIQHLVVLYFITQYGSKATKIEKKSNGILFNPLGTLIPELSWATIRIHINITDSFQETNDLCKGAYIMNERHQKTINKYGGPVEPRNAKSISAHQLVTMTKDIDRYCIENTNVIEEIIDVFNLVKAPRLKFSPQRKGNKKDKETYSLTSHARQVVIGTVLAVVGIVTSLVSIFSSSELVGMAGSQDTEDNLIDNSNNIITSIQAHETRIHKEEEATKQIKTNLKELEKQIIRNNALSSMFINIFTLKTFASTISRHLIRFQDGLYQLLKNKLSPRLIPLRHIKGPLMKLQELTRRRGYNLAIKNPSDVFMSEASL